MCPDLQRLRGRRLHQGNTSKDYPLARNRGGGQSIKKDFFGQFINVEGKMAVGQLAKPPSVKKLTFFSVADPDLY